MKTTWTKEQLIEEFKGMRKNLILKCQAIYKLPLKDSDRVSFNDMREALEIAYEGKML